MTALTEHPSIEGDTVVAIVGEVFTGLFGEERGRPYEDDAAAELPVRATVSVTGGWECTITITCTAALVTIAAAELFGMSADAVSDADLRDVVGELANVVGGNIKSMMPGPSALSLPVTDIGGAPINAQPTAGLAIDLTWCRERMRVSLSTSTTSVTA